MPDKKGKRQRLWSWLTNKYQLIIRNEENFAEKTTVSFNYAKAFLVILTSFTFLFIFSLFMAKTLLSRWFDPMTGNRDQAKNISKLEAELDALEIKNTEKDVFIQMFNTMLKGGEEIKDTVEEVKKLSEEDIAEEDLPAVDSVFRSQFESQASTLVSSDWRGEYEEITDMFFISPVTLGEPLSEISTDVSRKYSVKEEHFGIDIVAKKDTPIKSISDGTVITSGWTNESGYVVGIQHKNNVLSFYKHNSAVLKKVGDFVKSGDIIAIIGNTGELSSGTHLHFELWYKGHSVNPEYFITF